VGVDYWWLGCFVDKRKHEAARRYCSGSVEDDALHETLDFQPDGLAGALERKRGFLALACPRI